MLYIEKGGDEQLKDELSAYNPLIPNGKELTATLMFEIDNPISREPRENVYSLYLLFIFSALNNNLKDLSSN